MDRFLARRSLFAAILIGSFGVANRAEAADPPRTRDEYRHEYQLEVRFEALPLVRLQPESARLTLDLPVGLLPSRQTWYGFDFDGSVYEWKLGVDAHPRPHLRLRSRAQARASLGVGFRLVIDDPQRTFRFRMSVLPRAAVASLSF